ncbi:hypothetical protein I4U23_021264 [Adineta vaga]|nr:hypothetical protein I4U23_021264 [Adineta vaga]
MEFNADLIDDRIWLGSFAAMQNTIALDSLHITHILSLIESDLPIDSNDNYIRKHIRVEDIETTDLLTEFDACYDFILNALTENSTNNVLIHCLVGVSRSATIACMWLMHRYKLSVDDALKRLRNARPGVQPNPSFTSQLYLFEQMNRQLDKNHTLYKEFQFERARLIYLDHDIENNGIDQKNTLRQEYRQAFTLPYGHAQCTITDTYVCRHCQRELFTNVDLSRHFEGVGLIDWFSKHGNDKRTKLSAEKECQQRIFTHCMEWIMSQIDTPENTHGDWIKCPECSTIIGQYHLNGLKCSCGRWITPGFQFIDDKIEKKECIKIDIQTKTLLS